MKRNKVLLGLYVGLLTLAGGVANAQTDRFYEVGPDNIGGQVSSIVVDCQDTNRNTLYAGATTGGLFVKSMSEEILRNLYDKLGVDAAKAEALSAIHDSWHHVPFYVGTGATRQEINLPISSMTQAPSGEIFIGTGSDIFAYGTTYEKMSRKGMGVYCYIPATNEFKSLAATATDTNFRVVNAMESFYDGDVFYVFVATNAGLYRWALVGGRENWNWNAAPTTVFTGRVDNIVISHYYRMAFFNVGNQVYRIGDVSAAPSNLRTVNISSSNTAFGGTNIGVKLAVSQGSDMVLYAMVINQNGYMDALYMTPNEQTWYTVTTSSVMPLTYNSGRECGAISVDPSNSRRVIIGGTNVLVGEGFVDGAYYQWTTASASEYDLNNGDYMANVYNNTSFVHSGIHQIVPVYHIGRDGHSYHTIYFATNGGIYSSKFYGRDGFDTVKNENMGLNNIQINALAVAPDGTIIMGANNNSCPMVEPRLSHVGGSTTLSWYDDGSLGNFNHSANVLWNGNGGAVAASSFQQVYPNSRRTILVSSGNANIGRSYADYLDYNNTTTWTTGSSFLTNEPKGGPAIGSLALWETENNAAFNNMMKGSIDTLGYIFRKRGNVWDTVWLALPGTRSAVRLQYRDSVAGSETITIIDTIAVGTGRGSSFKIKKDDIAIFNSRGNADYPFEYQFTTNDLRVPNVSGSGTHERTAIDSIIVRNPIQARMAFVADLALPSDKKPGSRAVWFSWEPTDFTKVFDSVELNSALDLQKQGYDVDLYALYEKFHNVVPIFNIQRNNGTYTENLYPRQTVFSKDALCMYVSAYDEVNHHSMLFRISGFENADFTKYPNDLYYDLSYTNSMPILHVDTLRYNNNVIFPRPISHIAVDGRNGQDRLVLTFEDYSNAMPNVIMVNNASTSSYTMNEIPLADATLPVYTAIVEDSTGTIFVGTDNGVFTKTATGSWQSYNKLSGVPVTTIVQQTDKLPVRRNLTHTGITANNNVFAKTKWPRAIYFGTYGRGVFMDMNYVTDTVNEIVDPSDYNPVSIPTVHSIGNNSIKLFPNPVFDEAHMVLNAATAGAGEIRVYDLNGRLVMRQNLGYVTEGEHNYTIDCNGMNKGMYLINVTISGHTATTKMVVR